MSQEQKNYSDYGYVGDEIITMSALDFAKLRGVVDAFLEKETTTSFPEKYKYINTENGEVIKNVNEKNKHLAKKVVDIDATLNSNPVVSRTAEGLELIDIKLMMNKIHKDMVDSGVARHRSEFENMNKEERNVFQELVKEELEEKEESLGETTEGTEE